jgi:hypothetical protein
MQATCRRRLTPANQTRPAQGRPSYTRRSALGHALPNVRNVPGETASRHCVTKIPALSLRR